MNRILMNGTHLDEYRVAIVQGQTVTDLDFERASHEHKKGNIYLGYVEHAEPSLRTYFIRYDKLTQDEGGSRPGFLPLKEVATEYYQNPKAEPNTMGIHEGLQKGQTVLVQVKKEERGQKGAALTSYITLAGCYLVLMPNNPSAGGISRRIEGEERDELRTLFNQLEIPENMSVIIRTAGEGRTPEELQWDLNALLRQWEAIQKAIQEIAPPTLVYQENDLVVRTIRDHFRKDIDEIQIDNNDLFQRATAYVRQVRPDCLDRIKFYQDTMPLFSRYQIESQIDSASQRTVRLPSGGEIVIDYTEALVSIDVNSARATRGGDIEETAYNTNLEAADEIARQLRLRDLGGLIVIDLIDMNDNRHQREVENRLREALRHDRARVQIGRISRFGLLEMSRQRIRAGIGDQIQASCPHCHGRGTVRSIESITFSVLRIIEENAAKTPGGQLQLQLPIEIATFLLNEKRKLLHEVEQRFNIYIMLIPNKYLEGNDYKLKRIKSEEMHRGVNTEASYQLTEIPEHLFNMPTLPQPEKAIAVAAVVQSSDYGATMDPPKTLTGNKSESIFKRFWQAVFGSDKEAETTAGIATSTTTNNQKASTAYRNNRDTRKKTPRNSTQASTEDANRRRMGGNNNRRRRGGSNQNIPNKTARPEIVKTEAENPVKQNTNVSKPTNAIATKPEVELVTAPKTQTVSATTASSHTETPGLYVLTAPSNSVPHAQSVTSVPHAVENEVTSAISASNTDSAIKTAEPNDEADQTRRRGRRNNRRRRGHFRNPRQRQTEGSEGGTEPQL